MSHLCGQVRVFCVRIKKKKLVNLLADHFLAMEFREKKKIMDFRKKKYQSRRVGGTSSNFCIIFVLMTCASVLPLVFQKEKDESES